MRRLLAIIGLGLALPVLVVLGLGADDGGQQSGYKVRAVFDNVAAAVPGEDVKVAGGKVGVIQSMDVTKDKKAAVVLRIDDKRFTPFRADATCTIRPQSLIGEKFVECTPGTANNEALAKIDNGDGKGQHLLPLARTSSPVDLDLINDINRKPYRQRLSILLNEFGTGLAGRGTDLNEVIHRANPALRQTDRVLATLARQNRVLSRLAVDSDTALAPLAREKTRLTGFIDSAGQTGAATAERRADIARGIERLPRLLAELKPTMTDLGAFAGQATPVARDLNTAGPDISRLIKAAGPFAKAATPSIETLGDAARTGRPAVQRARPLVRNLGKFGNDARPLTANLDKLTASIKQTGGINRLMDLLYYSTLSINGFDGLGHYLRAGLLVNLCSTYATASDTSCLATFGNDSTASSAGARPKLSAAELAKRLADPEAQKIAADGLAKQQEAESQQGSVPAQGGLVGGILGNGQTKQGKANIDRIRRGADQPRQDPDSDTPALDYLLGSD